MTLYDFKTFPGGMDGGWPKRKRGPVWGDWDHESWARPSGGRTYEECQAGRDPNILNIADPCRGLPSGGSWSFKSPNLKYPGMEDDYEKLPYTPSGNSDPLMFLAQFAGTQLGKILGNR